MYLIDWLPSLCYALGALYLEFLPKEYHYLLTFMSVFFSFGAVLASILGYIILPSTSCPEPTIDVPSPTCDMATQNYGWRIMLFSVGIITLLMLIARSFCLRLPETPKYLLNNNKHQETIIVLQDIAKMNGNGDVDIQTSDLHGEGQQRLDTSNSNDNMTDKVENSDDYDDEGHDMDEQDGLLATMRPTKAPSNNNGNAHYPVDTLADSDGIALAATAVESTTHHRNSRQFDEEERHDIIVPSAIPAFQHGLHTGSPSLDTTNSWTILMSDKWRLTLFLVWGIWTFTAMSFTMFNVFLPKYLETLGFEGEAIPTRKDVYWDYMIYSIAGVPGSVVSDSRTAGISGNWLYISMNTSRWPRTWSRPD